MVAKEEGNSVGELQEGDQGAPCEVRRHNVRCWPWDVTGEAVDGQCKRNLGKLRPSGDRSNSLSGGG